MARPRELYSGAAPQSMSMMGQGVADAYARAGEIKGKSMAALGQGIAQEISAVSEAYGDYKKIQSQVKADTAVFNSLKDYLPADFVGQQQALENNPKASLMDKQQFYQSAKGYLGAAIGQQYKMDQINAEASGRVQAAQKPQMLNNPDDIFGSIFSGTPVAPKTPTAVVPVDQSMQKQDTTQSATDLAAFLRQRGWSGRGPVPQALMDEYNALTGK